MTKAQKREDRRRKARIFLDNAIMYLATLGGVFFAKYRPAWLAKEDIVIQIDPVYFITTCVFAFGLLAAAEYTGKPNRLGKQKNLYKRIFQAVFYGLSAYTIIGG